MNLQLHLLSRITAVALLCLLATASYALLQSHRQAERHTLQIAESLGRQLEFQLLRIHSGIGASNPFPDFELWKQTGGQAGVCVAYRTNDAGLSRSLCNGTRLIAAEWPKAFESAYRRIFDPGRQRLQPVAENNEIHGLLTVTPSAELEIAEAWNKTQSLVTLSAVTISAVCLLVYLSISRALQPAKAIVSGLEAMATGHLARRLPAFDLNEWRRIAAAINHLAASQQNLLRERQKLVVKLINLQEEERRDLARELHDEFGQCLAAISAVATSIKQTAARQCPALTEEADHVGHIAAHMLGDVRHMLGRLRPAEFDELGLAASLDSLVAGWNARSGGNTRYHLSMTGDCGALSESQAMTLFRIAQECLTNVAKHASASRVGICLTISEEAVTLSIQDDGIATTVPLAGVTGIGLLGIRERLAALCGQLRLAIAAPRGLIVEARLPLHPLAETVA